MKKYGFLILFLLSLTSPECLTQYYVTGQDPASLHWKQIETGHFRLIFPESFSPRAVEYARLLEESFPELLRFYPRAKAGIPVIIHNYSMLSNGYVSWAPKRMELYPVPGQDNLPDDPSKLLIVHEMTHVAEISSLNYGFTRFLSLLAGEQATGAASAMLPLWSLEGDAVWAETSLTDAGRGRSNEFMQEAKAIALTDKGYFGYNKMLFGSYRDHTPDHYAYGYAIMDHLHSQYPGFWEENVDFTGRNSWMILPTNFMLRSRLGLNKNRLYKEAFDSLTLRWQTETRNHRIEQYRPLNPAKEKSYADYRNPVMMPDGRIVALKRSFSDPLQFVLIDTITQRESVVHTPGILYPYIFSYARGRIVWAELHPDPRWENRDYSVLKISDLSTGRTRQLTYKTRYTAPALSHRTGLIAAVNTLPDLSTSLVIIDPESGDIVDEIPAPEGFFLQRPAWSDDNRFLIAVVLSSEGEGVARYSFEEKKWSFAVPPSHTDIIEAQPSGNDILVLQQDRFSDNIYLVSQGRSASQITFSPTGVSSFSLSGNFITFADNTARGNIISSVPFSSETVFPAACDKNLYQPDFKKEPESAILPDTASFEIKPYRRALHLFKLHSWAPFYFDTDEIKTDPMTVRPGLTLLSQNNLSTLISSFGYEYNNGFHVLHSKVKWLGWYPVIEAGISYGRENFFSTASDKYYFSNDIKHIMSYDVSIYQPLYFNYGKFYQYIMPAIYINYINNSYYLSDNTITNVSYTLIKPRLYFSNTFHMASRDIYPRWGQVTDIQAVLAPFDSDIFHSLAGFRSVFYLPSFTKSHGIRLVAGYESQYPLSRGILNNINSFPRGYNNLVSQKLASFSADYTFPLFYPDLSAGSLLYLKRVRASLFLDKAYSTGTYSTVTEDFYPEKREYGSYGAELLADFYLFRIPYEISGGIRAGSRQNGGDFFAEGVFSVNVYGSVLGRHRRSGMLY